MMKNIFGSFFQELTGLNVSECETIKEIDSKISAEVHIAPYNSNVVHARGNIFRYTRKHIDIDHKIDQYLSCK